MFSNSIDSIASVRQDHGAVRSSLVIISTDLLLPSRVHEIDFPVPRFPWDHGAQRFDPMSCTSITPTSKM
jgi:hypothetical protein